jgi:peroxiredoxin
MTLGKIPIVGQIARDFELPDSTTTPQRLSLMTSQGPVVLLFYRGYW